MVTTELSAGEWTLDTKASSTGFHAQAVFGMKVKGRFDRYESAIMVGPSGGLRDLGLHLDRQPGYRHQEARRAPQSR